jgi:UDP-N-acetylmuramate dehydrogenase
MEILENVSLKPYNTFGIESISRYFSRFGDVEELQEILSKDTLNNQKRIVLGGGSNLLFTGNFDGLILKNECKGINILSNTDEYVDIEAGAGENWHVFVMYCVDNGYAGIENLSLIPGNVGASPMQNIGAYGVEIKDTFLYLKAFDTESKTVVTFQNSDCEFDYRSSVFKTRYAGRFIILSVVFRLHKRPEFKTEYGAIREELEKAGIQELSIRAISDAVIRIRRSKLPDPAEIGNAGSFFKNPSIPVDQYQKLRELYPTMPGYPSTEVGKMKVAAGWLIEQAGWKGYRAGDAGVHRLQALVLVNYGKSSGSDIYNLSSKIMESIYEKFGINLEREVNII